MDEGGGMQSWRRSELVDKAVDHVSVAEAIPKGPLAVMEVLLARCRHLGVPDVTLAEVVKSWASIMG